jgi:hypothetical protein
MFERDIRKTKKQIEQFLIETRFAPLLTPSTVLIRSDRVAATFVAPGLRDAKI